MTIYQDTVTTFVGTNDSDYAQGGDGSDNLSGGAGFVIFMAVSATTRSTSATTAMWPMARTATTLSPAATWSHTITPISWRAGETNLTGGNAYEGLLGGSGNDTINGGDGVQFMTMSYLTVSGDADVLNGGDGDDYIVSTGGIDTIDGGIGNDYLQLIRSDDTVGLSLELFAPSGDATIQGDGTTIVGIENITFYSGSGNDTVTLFSGYNNVQGGDGDDEQRHGIRQSMAVMARCADRRR
jgi:Ca2+-binding RTX toxin-like protein